MKNKRGFTIVELLAVVALLGILSTIAVTAVTKYLTAKQNDVYYEYEENMATAAENYLLENVFKNHLTLEELIDTQYSSILIDPKDQDDACSGYVNITKDSSANLSYRYDVCLICDNYKSESCN